MLKNYFKIAFRNLWKNRVFTLLNILGLTVAFCVATLLSISSLDTLSQDQFHINKDNLYQVYATEQSSDGPEIKASRSIPFAPTIKKEVPGIHNITRHLEENILVYSGDKSLQFNGSYVDKSFLELFSFSVLKGDNQPLNDKNSVAITKEAAEKLFNSTDIIGETLLLDKNGIKKAFIIKAVLNDIPNNSSIGFDVLIPFENSSGYNSNIDRWGSRNHSVYLQLANNVSALQFEERSRDFAAKHYQEVITNAKRDGFAKDANEQYLQFRLFPFKDSAFATYKGGIIRASRTMPYLVIAIALLILFIASVNFINMTVAKSSQRLQEIGMRKTLGASKQQLFAQLWIESVFIFAISLVLGLLLGYGLLNDFQTLFRTDGSFSTLLRPNIVVTLTGIILVITALAGGYPAFLLSKLGTLTALKGKMNVKSGSRLRNTLMIIQFGIAILLISGTLVLNNQISFLRQMDLGFNKSSVVSIPFNGELDSRTALSRLRNELESQSEIISVTAADNNLGRGKDGSGYTSVSGFDYEGRGIKTHNLTVDYDYTQTLGMEIIKGRNFSRDYASDSLSMVINETMAKQYGKDNPLDVNITFDDSTHYSVIGVVKDYNFQGLQREVAPITMFMDSRTDFYYAFVKVNSKNIVSAFDKIESAWKSIEPNTPFLGSFLDENIDRTFRREKTLSTIITSGSIVAIILSCIGLFAISMIMVNERTKEIGVRKIVGASVLGLTKLLLQDFIKLVLLAFAIAAPLAWWMSYKWLEDYPYKISLNIDLFLLAGFITVFIAILTISFKTFKAALQNPVNSLRSE